MSVTLANVFISRENGSTDFDETCYFVLQIRKMVVGYLKCYTHMETKWRAIAKKNLLWCDLRHLSPFFSVMDNYMQVMTLSSL